MLCDAGPLVALLNRRDRNHRRCRDAAANLVGPLETVWPAFTEAMYWLSPSWKAQNALWEMVHCDALEICGLATSDCPRMRQLMEQYRDLPMDLADAALVAVAERENIQKIFTLDRRDFGVYRPKHVNRLEIIP